MIAMLPRVQTDAVALGDGTVVRECRVVIWTTSHGPARLALHEVYVPTEDDAQTIAAALTRIADAERAAP